VAQRLSESYIVGLRLSIDLDNAGPSDVVKRGELLVASGCM